MPFTPNQRSALRENDRYWGHKFILRLVIILLSTIAIALFASLHTWYPDIGRWNYMLIAWLAVITLWSSFVLLYLVLRRKPVHPGWRVALDLLLWLAGIYMMFVLVWNFFVYSDLYVANGDAYYDDDYTSTSRSTSYLEESDPSIAAQANSTGCADYLINGKIVTQCLRKRYNNGPTTLQRTRRILIAGTIFAGLVQLLELASWIWAAIDTAHHNRRVRDVEIAHLALGSKHHKHHQPEKVILVRSPEATYNGQPTNVQSATVHPVNAQQTAHYDGNNSDRGSSTRSLETIRAPYNNAPVNNDVHDMHLEDTDDMKSLYEDHFTEVDDKPSSTAPADSPM